MGSLNVCPVVDSINRTRSGNVRPGDFAVSLDLAFRGPPLFGANTGNSLTVRKSCECNTASFWRRMRFLHFTIVGTFFDQLLTIVIIFWRLHCCLISKITSQQNSEVYPIEVEARIAFALVQPPSKSCCCEVGCKRGKTLGTAAVPSEPAPPRGPIIHSARSQ